MNIIACDNKKEECVYAVIKDSTLYGHDEYERHTILNVYYDKEKAEEAASILNSQEDEIPDEYKEAGWSKEEYHKTFGKCVYHVEEYPLN